MVAELAWITGTNTNGSSVGMNHRDKERGKCELRNLEEVTIRGEIKLQKDLQGNVLIALDTLKWNMDIYVLCIRFSLQFHLNEISFYSAFLGLLHGAISWHPYARIYLHISLFENWLYWVLSLALGRSSFWDLPGWDLWEFICSSLPIVQERWI